MEFSIDKIENVEIFRTGTWKGKLFVEQDLDEMVRNWREFSNGWFRPAIKAGHNSEPGQPALGYLDNIRRVGNKLVADMIDLPVKIYEAIKGKRYDRVSAEIMPNYKKSGVIYGKVLTALAILGPEIPEVTGLKPLRECFGGNDNDTEYFDTELTINKEVRTMENIGDEIDVKVKEYLFQHPAMDYSQAMEMIFQSNPQLKYQYAGTDGIDTYSENYPAGKFSQKQIGDEVHRRIEILLSENPALSYAEAMIRVLSEDLELKKAYHGSYYKEVK